MARWDRDAEWANRARVGVEEKVVHAAISDDARARVEAAVDAALDRNYTSFTVSQWNTDTGFRTEFFQREWRRNPTGDGKDWSMIAGWGWV